MGLATSTVSTTAAATTAVAASAATTASAVTTAAATATASATTGTLFAGSCFVDRQGTATVILIVQTRNRGLRFGIGAHFHEPETFAPARFTVLDHFSTGNVAKLAEQLLQFRAAHAVAEVAYVQLLTHHQSPTNEILRPFFFAFRVN